MVKKGKRPIQIMKFRITGQFPFSNSPSLKKLFSLLSLLMIAALHSSFRTVTPVARAVAVRAFAEEASAKISNQPRPVRSAPLHLSP